MLDLVVAIEGLDGAGKSATAQRLARSLGASLQRLPPIEMEMVKPELLEDLASPARYLYYLSAVVRIGEHIRERHGLHIVDRYVDSAHAMHAPFHPEFDMRQAQFRVVEPDLVILLEVSENVRLARLRSRGRPLDTFERALLDEHFRDRVLRRLRGSRNNVAVHTSALNEEAVAEACAQLIHDKGEGHEVPIE